MCSTCLTTVILPSKNFNKLKKTSGSVTRSILNQPYEDTDVGRKKEGKEMFYLTTHSTHYILRLYGVGHIASDHMCYSFQLTARVLLHASSHRQDNTYHSLCYTSRGALAGTRNSSIGPPHEGSIRRPIAP